ncbi:MAG: MarR family transcriptional regulator [Candidatus Nanopelagicales bacterium]
MTLKDAELDPRVTTFGRLLEACHGLEVRLGAQLEGAAGIPLGTFEVLLRLSRSPEGALTMGELSRQLALTTGGITRLVDRLADAGLVERRPSPTDRRVQYAVITRAGETTLRSALAHHTDALVAVFEGFSAKDLATLDRLLDRLRGSAS